MRHHAASLSRSRVSVVKYRRHPDDTGDWGSVRVIFRRDPCGSRHFLGVAVTLDWMMSSRQRLDHSVYSPKSHPTHAIFSLHLHASACTARSLSGTNGSSHWRRLSRKFLQLRSTSGFVWAPYDAKNIFQLTKNNKDKFCPINCYCTSIFFF